MKDEILIPRPQLSKELTSHNAPILNYNLPFLIEKLKQKHSKAPGELNAIILLKSLDTQIVLTALHEGTAINSFQSNDSITFQIIEGKLNFHTATESVKLDQGQLHTLREKTKYSLTTNEETVFLLTIAGNTSHSTNN